MVKVCTDMHNRHSMLLLLVLGLVSHATAIAIPAARRQQTCNGEAAFCSRKYSNVSLVGTHNAPFVGSIDDPRVNQQKSVTEQLDAGIRFLQGQTHTLTDGNTSKRKRDILDDIVDGVSDAVDDVRDVADDAAGAIDQVATDVVFMCHTNCALLNAGTLANYLSTIKTWLDANPDEVVTLLLVNGAHLDIDTFSKPFEEASIIDYAFVPSTSPEKLPQEAWPTYGTLINDNKRLIIFLDSGADESQVPYILGKTHLPSPANTRLTQPPPPDEFTYFFETPYDTTDPSFNQCTLDRPANSSPDGKMYLVNHDLDKEYNLLGQTILVPDNEADFTTNAATGEGSIGAQADLCEGIYGRKPNVVLVDMFDRGDVFAAQDALNGV